MMPVRTFSSWGAARYSLDHEWGSGRYHRKWRVIARGEIVVVEDDNARLGVSLTEIAGLASTAV